MTHVAQGPANQNELEQGPHNPLLCPYLVDLGTPKGTWLESRGNWGQDNLDGAFRTVAIYQLVQKDFPTLTSSTIILGDLGFAISSRNNHLCESSYFQCHTKPPPQQQVWRGKKRGTICLDLPRVLLLCVTQPLTNGAWQAGYHTSQEERPGWRLMRVSQKKLGNKSPQEFVLKPVMFMHLPVLSSYIIRSLMEAKKIKSSS